MNNDNRRSNRQRHKDWQDEYNEERERDGNQQGYRRDDWQERDRSGYNRGASQSGYGSSMSSMGGGQGSYYPTEGGYMHDSRYADYGRDHRRYTDNYYNDHDRNWENYNRDSRRFMQHERGRMSQPRYGQSYQSAYGDGGIGDHMGYGEKGAMYRDEFHGRYGAGSYDERNERSRGERDRGRGGNDRGSQGNYDRDSYGDNQGYGTGRGRGIGSRSYFANTNSDAYHDGGENFWNIGNYGERRTNESGYGYGDGYDDGGNRNRNDRNYTW